MIAFPPQEFPITEKTPVLRGVLRDVSHTCRGQICVIIVMVKNRRTEPIIGFGARFANGEGDLTRRARGLVRNRSRARLTTVMGQGTLVGQRQRIQAVHRIRQGPQLILPAQGREIPRQRNDWIHRAIGIVGKCSIAGTVTLLAGPSVPDQ